MIVFHDLGVKYGQKEKIMQKRAKNDTKGMVISHQKWKIAFFESLMNFKHERSNSEIFMISG